MISQGAVNQERVAAEEALQRIAGQVEDVAAEASREAGIQRARAGASEAQLAKLDDLPAALGAAMRQHNKDAPKERNAAAKKQNRGSRSRDKDVAAKALRSGFRTELVAEP